MPVDPLSAATGAAVKEGIQRLTPKGIEAFKMWWAGKSLIVLGPIKAGKTSFMDYFQYGLLIKQRPTDLTLDLNKRESFMISLGRDGALNLRLRIPLDGAGHIGAIKQIDYVKHNKPNCIIIVTDMSSSLEESTAEASITWLSQFCFHLCALLKNEKRVAKKLKLIIVIMNKSDLVPEDVNDNKAKRKSFEESIRQVLDKKLEDCFSLYGIRNIPIMPCCSVKTKLGASLIDEVISNIALLMSRK